MKNKFVYLENKIFKTHSMKMEDFIKLYPKFEEFDDLRKKLDPKKTFFNKYLEEIFD